MRETLITVIGLILLPLVTVETVADCPQFADGVQIGTVQSSLINEASGIAASRENSDVLWTHNDSGDSARVFAMNTEGTHLGIYYLSGASATDWEDMAIGPGPTEGIDYLYIGDIGDNSAVRSSIKIYRVPEPTVDENQSPVNVNLTGVESITLQYPDGARDAETLMIDSVTKDIYIISKREIYSRVYLATYPQSTSSTITMEYKGQLPWGWAVGGDVSTDGSLVIVRRNANASIWRRDDGVNLWEIFTDTECPVSIIWEPQGEAICFDTDGCGYYTVSEQSYQPIYYFARDGLCPEPAITGDFDGDNDVDSADLAFFLKRWLNDNCKSENYWCDGADIDQLNDVDMIDFAIFARHWLEKLPLDIRINSGNDDAEELNSGGSMYITSTDLEFVYDDYVAGDQTIGIRFNNVQIDNSFPVAQAYIQFTVDETVNLNPCHLTIYGQAFDNAESFSLGQYDISSRPTTTASVEWNPPAWTVAGHTDAEQRTPDIASVIQEVVNRPGWVRGNSLVIIITGTGRRTAEAYEGSVSAAPLLHIEFAP